MKTLKGGRERAENRLNPGFSYRSEHGGGTGSGKGYIVS